MHLCTITTVTVYICTVTITCAFNILLVFSLSCLCPHSHSHLTLSLSLVSPHLTPPFPHLLSLSPLSPVKPCLHCHQSSNLPLPLVKSITLVAMSKDASSYPPIEPTNFDLIVLSTSLPESMIAAAASANGKIVLHLDPNPFYGSNYTSLSLHDLSSFLISHSALPHSPSFAPSDGHDFIPAALIACPLFSHIEISSFAPDVLGEEHSRNGFRIGFVKEKR